MVWLKIQNRLTLDGISLLYRKFIMLSRDPTVHSQLSPMSQSYHLAQSALQHCYLTYADGDLTLDEYLVLKQAVRSVLLRSIVPNYIAPKREP